MFKWINGELVQVQPPEEPKEWYMTNEERRIEFQKNIVEQHAWQCCLNCESWVDGKNGRPHGCSLFKAMPPPEVILHGCKDYQDEIPF